jgi:general secretion pathway protein G
MASTFKRSASRGFTLIELLIVVIILAILAAIAIPQFSSSTSDAQLSALDANLSTVRSAIEQYKAQHKNTYPGVNTATGNTCTVGSAAVSTATAGTRDALDAQLKGYSNADGQVCDSPNAGYVYGPYLRKGIPVEPISNSAAVAVTSAGTPIVPTAATAGWAYDTKSGQFVANSNTSDSGSPARKYYEH